MFTHGSHAQTSNFALRGTIIVTFPKYLYNFANKKITRDASPVSGKNDATDLRNILKDNYKTQSTFQILSKSSCNDVLVPRALMSFISEATPQTEMLCNCSDDPLSTDHQYVM